MFKLKNKLSLLILFVFLLVTSILNFFPTQANALTNIPNQQNINYNAANVINDFQGVADYIHKYNCLPDNYITKQQARDLGWTPGQDLWAYAPGKSIGGDIFTNSEGSLPSADGRIWYECDINYNGNNLDALWDCITTDIDLPVKIIWNDFNKSKENLGNYAFYAANLFIKASQYHKNNFIFVLNE